MRATATMVLVVWAAGATSAAQAQESSQGSRPFTFEIGVGFPLGSSAESVEQAMKEAGLDESVSCSFICLRRRAFRPVSNPGALGARIAVGYRVHRVVQLRGMVDHTPLSTTWGYGRGQSFSVHLSSRSYAALAAIYPGERGVAFVAGPSLDHIQSVAADDSHQPYGSALIPGFSLGARLELPSRRRLHVSVAVLRHWAAETVIGPIEVYDENSASLLTTVPGFTVETSYTAMKVGVGLNW